MVPDRESWRRRRGCSVTAGVKGRLVSPLPGRRPGWPGAEAVTLAGGGRGLPATCCVTLGKALALKGLPPGLPGCDRQGGGSRPRAPVPEGRGGLGLLPGRKSGAPGPPEHRGPL